MTRYRFGAPTGERTSTTMSVIGQSMGRSVRSVTSAAAPSDVASVRAGGNPSAARRVAGPAHVMTLASAV